MNPADHLYHYGHLPQAESVMEFDQLIILVERVGLPAVIIGACFYYIMKTQQAHRDEIVRWENKDSEGDSRLIDVIKEQNARNEHFAKAIFRAVEQNLFLIRSTNKGISAIISNKGGLPETVTHGIILKELNVDSVYNAIKDLIENKLLSRKI